MGKGTKPWGDEQGEGGPEKVGRGGRRQPATWWDYIEVGWESGVQAENAREEIGDAKRRACRTTIRNCDARPALGLQWEGKHMTPSRDREDSMRACARQCLPSFGIVRLEDAHSEGEHSPRELCSGISTSRVEHGTRRLGRPERSAVLDLCLRAPRRRLGGAGRPPLWLSVWVCASGKAYDREERLFSSMECVTCSSTGRV